jgi:hypothetical protein
METFDSKRLVSTNGMIAYDIRDGKIVIKNDQAMSTLGFVDNNPVLTDVAPSQYIKDLPEALAVRTLASDVKVGDVILVKNNRRAYPRFVGAINGNKLTTIMSGGGVSERIPMIDELSGEQYHYILQNQGALKMPGAAELYERETKGYGQALTESFKKALAGIESETE